MEDVCEVDTRGGEVEMGRVQEEVEGRYVGQVKVVELVVHEDTVVRVVGEIE